MNAYWYYFFILLLTLMIVGAFVLGLRHGQTKHQRLSIGDIVIREDILGVVYSPNYEQPLTDVVWFRHVHIDPNKDIIQRAGTDELLKIGHIPYMKLHGK